MGILLSLSSSHTLVYEKSRTCMKRNNNNILQQSRSICSRTAGAGSAKRHGMVRTGTALSLWRDQRPGHGGTAPRQTGESGGGVPRRLCLWPVRGGALHADDGSVRSSELEEQQKATPSCLFPPRSLAPPAPAASSCMPVPVLLRCAVTKLLNARCALARGWLAAAAQRSVVPLAICHLLTLRTSLHPPSFHHADAWRPAFCTVRTCSD